MKHVITFVLFFAMVDLVGLSAQTASFENVLTRLKHTLNGNDSMTFKEAVFIVENAYLGQQVSQEYYERRIGDLKKIAQKLSGDDILIYDQKDSTKIKKHAALYTLITDTTTITRPSDTIFHYPFAYDFDDPFGKAHWPAMFVTKLLETKQGNCHSLPYLYKILADELGIEAHLALAPNHIYIKNRCEKTGWYNTELTSASFPVDAWIMASGYVHLEAIQNGIYMKALGDTESIAMCVVDLAMGYDRKFPDNDGAFVLKCCELALKHFPNYITAILLKAETMKRLIEQMMEQHSVQHPKDLFTITSEAEPLWKQMEQTYFHAHQLGYRQMPQQMYLEWLASLTKERENYENRNVTRF